VLEGTLVLLVRRTFARTACERASGELVSRLGRKIFGPTRRAGSRQEGVQETIESASCVAARNAESESPTGTTGALEASAEHSETLHGVAGVFGVVPLTASTVSPGLAAEGREIVPPCEVLTFAVCPGSASGCRSR
jgi:hypothetical protein